MSKLWLSFLLMIFPCAVQAQDWQSGFYQLKTTDPSKPGSILVYIKRDGNSVELYDLEKNKKLKSEIVETEIHGIENGGVVKTASFHFAGRKEYGDYLVLATAGKGFVGFGLSKNKQTEVAVASVPFVWACGNHTNPTHTATSPAEREQLTREKHCELWHLLKPEDMK
jgi:hypothetical protein